MNGYLLNYTISIRDAFVRKPADYSVAAVDRLGETYASDTAFTGDLPNIIVIMNESFADLSVFGDELRTNIPVTPFMDSFKEEAVSGWALSSVYGGNTANAEFEFLTGATMGFLPEGSVPYQQYIKGNVFSLAWVLDGLGYDCRATHPFHAGGWSRTRIYPQLGFSAWHFVDEYPQKDLVREYVSDREMYAYILEMLEKDTADAPLFLFGITMQNHGGYGYEGENYEQTVFLQGYSGDYPEAEQYLTLIHESDAAMASFVAELSALEEKTVLLFFGDHHPKLGATLHTELHGDEIDTLEEQMLQYTVPFYIWANFDIPEYTIECTSLNYLAMHVLQVAGIDLPAPYRFLEEMRETIPAMNALGYYSAEQDKFISYDDAAGEESVWLQNYAILQYNNLFDAENRSEKLFGRYIGQKK